MLLASQTLVKLDLIVDHNDGTFHHDCAIAAIHDKSTMQN